MTNFYLRVHERPKAWNRSVYVYPAALTEQVMRWAYGAFTDVDPRVEIALVGQYLPPELTGASTSAPSSSSAASRSPTTRS